MRHLYKFIEQRHSDAFFETGSIRLGTVHSFKDTVEHGVHRGDEEEGLHHVKRDVDGTVTLRRGIYHPVISEVFRMDGPGESSISNLTIKVARRSADAFIFCTSVTYSEGLFELWSQRENLDACYEIFDPRGFALAVSRVIKTSANFVAGADVVYIGKDIDYRSPQASLSPAITKRRNEYSWQQEHRMLWAPMLPSPPLQPWIIRAPEARRFCRPLAHRSNGAFLYA